MPTLKPGTSRVAGAFDAQIAARIPAAVHDLVWTMIVTESAMPSAVRPRMTTATCRARGRTAVVALRRSRWRSRCHVAGGNRARGAGAGARARDGRRAAMDRRIRRPGLCGRDAASLARPGSSSATARSACRRFACCCALTGSSSVGLASGSACRAAGGAAIVIGLGYGPITPASSQCSHGRRRRRNGADVLDQADRRSRRRRAGGGRAARSRRGVRVAADIEAVGVLGLASPSPRSRRARSSTPTAGRARLFARGHRRAAEHGARQPTLAGLALTGFAYAAMQVCLTSFLVVFLAEALGLVAGAVWVRADCRHLGGDHRPDRLGRRRRPFRPAAPTTLGLLGISRAFAAYATAASDAGVAEVGRCCRLRRCSAARRSAGTASSVGGGPARAARTGGAVTGASGFITFTGVVVGPPLFARWPRDRKLRVGFAVSGRCRCLRRVASRHAAAADRARPALGSPGRHDRAAPRAAVPHP